MGEEVENASIEVLFPLVDRFGNTEIARIALVRLEGALYEQINQALDDATLNLDIIPRLADWAFVHPSLADTDHFADLLG